MNVKCDSNASSIIDGDYIKGIFEFNSTFRTIEITGNIKKIPSYCFHGCSELVSVSLFSKITSIGHFALSHCEKLKNISIPTTVESIGIQCFSYCLSLNKIDLPNSISNIQDGSFSYCTWISDIKLPKCLEQISRYAFIGCGELKNISLPVSLKIIQMHAFSECSSLIEIVIPDSVIGIDINAFSECHNLQRIQPPMRIIVKKFGPHTHGYLPENCIINYTFKENETRIKAYSFFRNKRVTEINLNKIYFGSEKFDIPENLTHIEEESFYECLNLKKIILSEKIISIGNDAFNSCVNLTIIMLNNIFISLGIRCFENILAICQFPEQHSGFQPYQYYGQYNIEAKAPTDSTFLPPFCFYNSSLTSLKLNGMIKTIGTYCFAGTNVEEVNLYGVEILGGSAFAESRQLKRVLFSDSIKFIGEYAFYNCSRLIALEFSSQNAIDVLQSAFESCSNLDISTILLKMKYIPVKCFYNVTNIESINIHSNIDRIEDYAFCYASNVKSLVIEEGIRTIGKFSFNNVNITTIILPDSLTSIGEYCFGSCSNLVTVRNHN
ncbi:surface antigen BspA-like [Trichomonas vaginalis G3]|uniref:Surface antigen BspA-like n=1 Tax=Trichomonas vaginalis (strain ATCC PRA-98 / G3) TaxID=412133 RepID=A2DNI8_TRIV3|nr:leucine-rich repeats (6 copies)-containing protein [Trichomonas vaginalis G3]EAY17991.1 surface antigen BspA-like [Trichomonas vaginalis G3]KAI5499075.1 leucine-rich repeats (6 copies)-containing protein [Trichomonas vaginalis G3]|eukprot:XP_001578977.1 surface antigen BspA-like [Trichomonas vaginalis G3]